jgi:hypothetical protein
MRAECVGLYTLLADCPNFSVDLGSTSLGYIVHVVLTMVDSLEYIKFGN